MAGRPAQRQRIEVPADHPHQRGAISEAFRGRRGRGPSSVFAGADTVALALGRMRARVMVVVMMGSAVGFPALTASRPWDIHRARMQRGQQHAARAR